MTPASALRPAPRASVPLALLLLALALPLAAAPGASAQGARTKSPARATPAAGPRSGSRPATADTGAAGRPRVAPRTLDDIHIEGEIPVPQVLFITARDQRRFLEFQHHRYQRTSRELGRATPIPSRLVVTTPQPTQKKENPR